MRADQPQSKSILTYNLRKFDYLKLSVKNKNIEISYGNGLDCKNKGKSPLCRSLKLGPIGDSCAEVGEESLINDQ